MKNKRSFGGDVVKSLRDFLKVAEAGERIRQSVIRRMNVKGKTIYVRDSFTAPIKKAPSK